jgi:lipoyl(octanoyl) transferase
VTELWQQNLVIPWSWLGRVPYDRALALQRWLRQEVVEGRSSGALLLLEHPPTLTQGRSARQENLRASPQQLERLGIPLFRVERGGDVTYHGPGQLVGYPVLPVRGGVRRFVEALGEAARVLLEGLGIEAAWDPERPGLWTAKGKIAAVGLHVHRGVAIHGVALNVAPDLGHFDLIVPCGICGARVTSVRAILGEAPPLEVLAASFASAFAEALGMTLGNGPAGTREREGDGSSRMKAARLDALPLPPWWEGSGSSEVGP